jgi:hypothetical protein
MLRDLLERQGKSFKEAEATIRRIIRDEGLVDAAVERWNALIDSNSGPEDGFLIRGVGASTPWYPGPRPEHLYWPALRDHLASQGWSAAMLEDLDRSSSTVLASCRTPWAETKGGRGLVVGYVQSGKTTNFTAIIAKAADVGFRLFIVLSGTTKSLRRQTQARLDEQLHDLNPLTWSFPTNKDQDFASGNGIGPILHVPGLRTCIVIKKNKSRLKRLNNFLDQAARLGQLNACPILVIDDEGDQASLSPKCDTAKATAINKQIVKIIDRPNVSYVAYTATPFANAFVNPHYEANLYPRDFIYSLPEPRDYFGSSALFGSDQLDVIRDITDTEVDSYVGPLAPQATESLVTATSWFLMAATATPVANVFINPDDPQDLFPGDFIISLKEPVEYFGASTFHDLDEPASTSFTDSNDAAFVRDITSEIDEDDAELRTAIDLFVLSAAVKLYRRARDVVGDFTHHTMLIHMSHLQEEHMAILDRVVGLWNSNQYLTGGAYPRLEQLLKDDIRPVNSAREPHLPLPDDFDELVPFIRQALTLIDDDGGPVKMINGHEDADRLNFDTSTVWKIIVGGTKLSRGYTIEGLTISYFRRTVGAQDSLLQMGRWFGYRPGYRDLPRLFIGRNEILRKATKTKPAVRIDLLEAFKGTCRAERSFRESLAMYAIPQPGQPRITPRDIAPIVELYFPDLPPVAKNRMWNAEVISENWGRRWIQPTFFSDNTTANSGNLGRLGSLVDSSSNGFSTVSFDVPGKASFSAVAGEVANADFEAFISAFEFSTDSARCFGAQLGFLTGGHGPHRIHDWLVVFPRLATAGRTTTVGNIVDYIDVVKRKRTGAARRINALAASVHRSAVLPISRTDLPSPHGITGAAAGFLSPNRGVALMYLVVDRDDANPAAAIAPAFELFPSGNSLPVAPKLRVRREGLPDVIDAE